WKLDDGEGGGAPYTLPANTRVEPGAFLVVHLPTALLNNDGDTVQLIRPDGVVTDSTSYSGSSADVSHGRDASGAWLDGMEPTPGAPNRRADASATPTGPASTLPDSTAPTETVECPSQPGGSEHGCGGSVPASPGAQPASRTATPERLPETGGGAT